MVEASGKLVLLAWDAQHLVLLIKSLVHLDNAKHQAVDDKSWVGKKVCLKRNVDLQKKILILMKNGKKNWRLKN